MKSFKKDKYLVLKNAISKDMALLAFNYLRIKKQILQSLMLIEMRVIQRIQVIGLI